MSPKLRKDPAPNVWNFFNNFVTASSILISVARLIFLFTLFDIGWEIWLRQTLKTNKMGTSFSNMKSLQTALYFWLFVKSFGQIMKVKEENLCGDNLQKLKFTLGKISDQPIIPICPRMTTFCGFTLGWLFNYSIPSTNDK